MPFFVNILLERLLPRTHERRDGHTLVFSYRICGWKCRRQNRNYLRFPPCNRSYLSRHVIPRRTAATNVTYAAAVFFEKLLYSPCDIFRPCGGRFCVGNGAYLGRVFLHKNLPNKFTILLGTAAEHPRYPHNKIVLEEARHREFSQML